MDTVAASGTTGRSTGVYFKLRSSRQTSLEGSKQFVLVLRVPRSWGGDLLYMRCRAVGLQSSLLKECRISQSSDFVIALYLERDAESKSRAAAYVEAERQLRRIATAHRDEINNRRWPSLLHKLGRAVNAVEPKIPVDWLHQFIHTRAPDTLPQFQRHRHYAIAPD